MNPESLDSSIQSALSALFPPFEATAPVVLSQLFRTIEERYHGDALQCLLDFLIPSKHLLENVQQAACAGYSDVVFRCEGWPLCLHDKTVIQLAPVNPLLLRPGDFYLQVEPFGDQAARIVLKSLLEEGCREVEETPLLETSYPCIFTEDWLQEINEGRHGTPLSRCLLCTDQGVIKLPWAKIAVPEFLDKPKIMPTYQESPPEPKSNPVLTHYNSSTLPVEALVLHKKDRMSASLRPADNSSKLVKMTRREQQMPRSCSKPSVKPVGMVSPNTWDNRNYGEIEGDYVDLLDFPQETVTVEKQRGSLSYPAQFAVFKPVRPPPPIPLGHGVSCRHALQYMEEPCKPCNLNKPGQEITDQDLKCRYRESYLAALRNPVPFEKGTRDLLSALEETGICAEAELRSKDTFEAPMDELGSIYNHSKEAVIRDKLCHYKPCGEPKSEPSLSHLKDPPTNSEVENLMKESPTILKSTPGLSQSQRIQTKLVSQQLGHNSGMHAGPEVTTEDPDGNTSPQLKSEVVKPSGKHKVKLRSLSTVSETSKGSPVLYKLNNRSQSDICPQAISSVIRGVELLDSKLERAAAKCPKKDSQSSQSETSSTTDGTESRLHNSKIEKPSSPQAQIPDSPQSPQTQGSHFRNICCLLDMGIICLPGSRDRTGRAVVEVHGDRREWTQPLVSTQTVCELLLYLHSIPRKDVQELGMTLVINARKKAPPLLFYRALLMAQEQALHAVHSITILIDKDTSPRPEKQSGLQMDVVTSMKALNKTVEASQLTPELGGTFSYSHADWVQFHQKLVSFMGDLQEADNLLQKAIKKVEGSTKTDSAQDVQQCIEEQRASMKEVLEDTRLVSLQREGGAALARMRREEFRFPQSEDYRDGLESVTSLYNQVEEKLHMLVMRSNESLQSLEFLFSLRETEAKISTVGAWFTVEAEQSLSDSYTSEDDLLTSAEAMSTFQQFFSQSKDKQQYALTLVTDAEKIVATSDSSPATDVFRTMISTFKSNVEGFMLRLEKRFKELEPLMQVHSFCSQASALAQECREFSEQVERGCYSTQTLSTLEMYEKRLGGEFSTQHFQAQKVKACSVGSGASGLLKVWNAAWVECQEARLWLEETRRQKQQEVDKNQLQQITDKKPPVKDGGLDSRERSESGVDQVAVTDQPAFPEKFKENHTSGLKTQQKNDANGRENKAPRVLISSESTAPNKEIRPVFSQNGDCPAETACRPREHQSAADLRGAVCDDFHSHKGLGRSLSEGSFVRLNLMKLSGLLPLNIRHKYCQGRTQPLEWNQQLFISHNENIKSGRLNWESRGDSDEAEVEALAASTQSLKDLRTQEALLTAAENNSSSVLKLEKIMEELLSTEREYVKALGYVREHYIPELERGDVPQDLRGQRGSIFGNLEKLHDFHQHHFLCELESCVNEPFRVGRCFLRHRERFALYALYSKNKPQSDRLLISHGQTFFKKKQLRLRDRMDLWSYLLKPIQRISKYSLLLQDMMRECGPAQSREMAEVKAALEVIHFQLRHGNNLLAMDAIHNCDVNLKEQGQLIRQDEFLVTFRKKKCFRHIFLFQELILFSKTRKTDVGNDTYVYKQSFKSSDIGLTQNSGDSGLCFEIWFRKRKSQDTYVLQAVSREVKETWTKDIERILWEQAIHNREIRMQERVFMGIGNKPFMDIQPSEAAISDRAVNYVLIGRENKALSLGGSYVENNGKSGGRPKSLGSGSSSASSSSSGGSAVTPMGYRCGPKHRVNIGVLAGYVSPPGALEDDLDQESGSQNLILDSSESSGESVSGFSSCSHGYHSAVPGEVEDTSSVCSSIITVKEARQAPPDSHEPNAPAASPDNAPSRGQTNPENESKNLPCSKVQNTSVGKSTEV